jgi:nucleotide-binding universal stress UspA family protein
LDKLVADPRLARRFPLDLARRFHALPVAEQDGRVTVAMANPDDQVARVAVETTLGLASFLVRVDSKVVDALIDAAWNTEDHDTLRMLAHISPGPSHDQLTQYAQQMASLLQADLLPAELPQEELFRQKAKIDAQAQNAKATVEACNLYLFDSTDHPRLARLLAEPGIRTRPETLPEHVSWPYTRAALIARHPRWPLQRILLVITGEDVDQAAVEWMLRLARASHSVVAALAVVPPVPAMYGQRSALAQTLPALLSSNSTMGRRMRHTARLMVEWEIEGTLRLRQGPPDWQIRRELADKEYDVVVMGTKPRRQWLRRLEGDGLCCLLRFARQPVLIALPASQ